MSVNIRVEIEEGRSWLGNLVEAHMVTYGCSWRRLELGVDCFTEYEWSFLSGRVKHDYSFKLVLLLVPKR